MSEPGALALTGVILWVMAAIVGISADAGWSRRGSAPIAWTMLTLGALALAGAAWWEAWS